MDDGGLKQFQTTAIHSTSTALKGEDMIQAKKYWVILLICVIIFACVCVVGWSQRGLASSTVTWEYKIVAIRTEGVGYIEEPERTMNKMGEGGWEFVQIITVDEIRTSQGRFLFKRAK